MMILPIILRCGGETPLESRYLDKLGTQLIYGNILI
jgi:hypothetical protein